MWLGAPNYVADVSAANAVGLYPRLTLVGGEQDEDGAGEVDRKHNWKAGSEFYW